MNKQEKIIDLCKKYKASVQVGDSLSIGGGSEQYRLMNNDIIFHELSYEELQTCGVSLTEILLFKNRNTIISDDHIHYWAWVGQVLLNSESGYFDSGEGEISDLLSTCIRSALARTTNPKLSYEENREVRNKLEFNSQELISKNNLILVQLSFPLLEAILRKSCKEYVDYLGSVKKRFKVGSNVRKYSYKETGNRKVSSIAVLLHLYYEKIATPEIRKKLDLIKTHLKDLEKENPKDAFEIIYEWRNSSLHGNENIPTIGGTILSIVLIIAVANLKDSYESIRKKLSDRINWELHCLEISKTEGHSTILPRGHWSYYPPYL
ncbi:hypothetical protein SFC11_02020 [Exiguobacterium indicum]|uniref:hypothetical protein n=1 Tax=Exiguobacterium TaxID=33986 RepID=UPI0028AD25B3|nr:hypothetical protein [Exiguobacterium sp.]